MTGLEALERIKSYFNPKQLLTKEKTLNDLKIIEKELKALEIIKKYPSWIHSINYLLFMANHWQQDNRTITKELLEDYDFPFEVEEFNLVVEVFK